MSHFYATIQGSRGMATRQGSKKSGMTSYTASWQGCVRVRLWEADGVDMADVSLETWHGRGAYPDIVLYHGPVGGEGYDNTVKIQVYRGMAEVVHKPEGIEVEIEDLDVEGSEILDVTEAAP